jgi:hypothetical protein
MFFKNKHSTHPLIMLFFKHDFIFFSFTFSTFIQLLHDDKKELGTIGFF